MTSNKEQLVVSMTGFVNDPNEESYKKMINELGIRLAPTLSEETSVLIVNDVTTQKYKIAKTYDQPITCVTIEWLLDCKKKNKIIKNTEHYHVDKLFYGAVIKVLDFQPQKSRKIEQRILENGGKVQILKNNTELQTAIQSEEQFSLLLTTRQNFARLRPYMEQICFPVVQAEWLQDSLRSRLCKFPFDYAMNQFYICQRQPIQHFKKMKGKLDAYLGKPTIDKYQHKILEDTIIHIADNVHPTLTQLLKKIIMVYGGFYLEELSPAVTHILAQPLTQQQYGQLKLYGTLVSLIRVEWLIDTVYLNKRMREEDYFIRCFKTKIASIQTLEERTNQFNQNSTSINSFGSLPLLNRKSISLSAQHSKPKQVKVLRKFESNIFHNYAFYIESTQKKEIQLNELSNRIVRNGGDIYHSRSQIKGGFFFYIIKDTSQRKQLIDRLKQNIRINTGKEAELQAISYRWVSDCLSKGQFIDYSRVQSYIYKPFDFKTPMMGFHKMIFDVLALDDVMKLRLKQLYNTLGSVKNAPNRIELTHCLCGPDFRGTSKYRDIKKDNPLVKYIDWHWILECVNQRKIVSTQFYLLQKQGNSSQESDNSNIQPLLVPV